MSNVFEKAIAFAMKAHEGQRRKGGGIYILHPLEDAVIVGTMTDDLELLAAAVLHDTVEDTSVTAQDLVDNFGERVAELVADETENKRAEQNPADTWKIRKEESLEVLKNAGIETKMLWLGDKLSNMRAMARDYDRIGVSVFDKFNQKDPMEQRWYHMKILEYTAELSEYAAYREFEYLFHHVFDKYNESKGEKA